MKRILYMIALALAAVSCGPTRHAIFVDMRYPSKSGIELAGKTVAVVHLENDNPLSNVFSEGIADGLAYSLEQDYGTVDGSIGIYRMKALPGGDYASRDTLFNLIMDTGADVLFLVDTLNVGEMTIGGISSVAAPESPDSAYLSTGNLPFKMKLHCFDAMNKDEKVYSYGGSSVAVPYAYSDGKQTPETIKSRALKTLPLLGFETGKTVSGNFKSQWKTEQYSVIYFESEDWYRALEYACQLSWKPAMDIWLELIDTRDMMKRSCAAYNMAVASYMLGDYELASQWLDRSDADNKLPLSETLRKRIDSRK